jgi:tetratricopeptide (TPR) repeat protein
MVMKKFLLTTLLAATGLSLFAQKLDKAKDLFNAKPPKLAEAKTEIDNVLADPKNAKNSEAWYYKAKIYNAVSNDNALAASAPDARWTAFEALKKYTETDDKKEILLQIDQYKPIMDIYQNYYKVGAADFNANKHESAFNNFKNCLAVSEFMASKGWTTVKLDTSVVLYTGISAEKGGKKDDAAVYYAKLADAKVNGEGMVEIYKWLTDYYAKKSDAASAKKYLALGKEVYPKDPFWNGYELEMLKDDKKALFAKYEEIIAQTPNDTTALYNYAVELYLYSYNEDAAKRPANSAEYIGKASDNMKKVLALKPDYGNANLVLGQIAYNQGVDINNEMKAIKPPAGGKLKPEELKKKEDLRAAAMKKFDEAIPYFEKIDQLLGGMGKLKMEDKKNLKEAYDLLITIYDNKGNKEKLKFYEEKFNNVEKVH